MRNAALSVLGFGLLSVCSPAQEPAVFYKPGDTVRIVVSFKSPVALSEGRFFFRLQDKLQETQHGFQTEFNGGQFSKSTDAEYEVSGVVGENIASGMWRLEIIDVFSAGVMNRYNFGKEFQKEVVVRIENPRHVRFPEIKDVTLQPPK